MIQVRAKGCTDRELSDFADRVTGLRTAAGALCLVDDGVDVVLAVGAAGAHLGAVDLPPAAARWVAKPGHLLGGTAPTSGSWAWTPSG